MAKRERPHIPQRPDEFTPDWFTGILDLGASVAGVRTETIGTDIGFMGEVYRCHLEWENTASTADRDLPSSVIIKVPTANDVNFAIGDGGRFYEREVVVYDELGTDLGLPLPHYHYGAMDPDPAPWLERPILFLFDKLPLRAVNWLTAFFLKLASKSRRRYIVVLEDIADARPPRQVQGDAIDDVLAALVILARFHAANWQRSDLVENHRVIWQLDRASRLYEARYLRDRDAVVERYGIAPDIVAKLDDIQRRFHEIHDHIASEPCTLLHGDYRLDNVLFRPDGTATVLDLQGLSYGRAAFDVAYFITTALTADHHRDEERLLRTYHDALVAEGVTGYGFDELVADCHTMKQLLAHRIVSAGALLDTQVSGDAADLIDVIQFRVFDWLD